MSIVPTIMQAYLAKCNAIPEFETFITNVDPWNFRVINPEFFFVPQEFVH